MSLLLVLPNIPTDTFVDVSFITHTHTHLCAFFRSVWPLCHRVLGNSCVKCIDYKVGTCACVLVGFGPIRSSTTAMSIAVDTILVCHVRGCPRASSAHTRRTPTYKRVMPFLW